VNDVAPPSFETVYEEADYRAFRRAVDKGDVAFHQVARAWFDSRFVAVCAECHGTGWQAARTLVGGEAGGGLGPEVGRFKCEACGGNGVARDSQRSRVYEEVFHELLDTFGEQRGGVVAYYFGDHIRVGAALTDPWTAADRADGPVRTIRELIEERQPDRRSWFQRAGAYLKRPFRGLLSSTSLHYEPTFVPDNPYGTQVLMRCVQLHLQAVEFLPPKARNVSARMTFSVITTLLGTIDRMQARGEAEDALDKAPEYKRVIEAELARAESYFSHAAQRTARLQYLGGMLVGLPLAALVALLLYSLPGANSEIAVSFLAGALGALVSVMERLTAGKLDVTAESGPANLRILGGIRPFIGALFGLALYAFIRSGLLDVFVLPSGADDRLFFYAAIGFLAGFSERWAQDMIEPLKAGAGQARQGLPPSGPRQQGP
jgi:hypothetical protein